ncbi:hypothetical protein D3C85_1007090 [compost metagenome]
MSITPANKARQIAKHPARTVQSDLGFGTHDTLDNHTRIVDETLACFNCDLALHFHRYFLIFGGGLSRTLYCSSLVCLLGQNNRSEVGVFADHHDDVAVADHELDTAHGIV